MRSLRPIDRLIQANSELVRVVVCRVVGTWGLKDDELLACGLVGLWQAAKRYRKGRGTAFNTYAWCCVANKLRDELRRRGRQYNRVLSRLPADESSVRWVA